MKLSIFGSIRRKWKKKSRATVLSKRQVFVVVTAILTILLIITQLSQDAVSYVTIIGLAVATYILCLIALREDLAGIELVTLFILPTMFTVAVSLLYFLLPQRLLTRLPFAVLYAVGMYAILLSENIYNVAAERTIQLLRAAQSVGFLITLITVFFLAEAILSLHTVALVNGGLVFVMVFFLALQSLWAMELETKLTLSVLVGSSVIAFIIAQATVVLSFWPIRTTIAALFIASMFYTLVGTGQQHLVGRLFRRTKNEFVLVIVAVFALVLFATKWGFGHFVN